jgi:hypothetical protein
MLRASLIRCVGAVVLICASEAALAGAQSLPSAADILGREVYAEIAAEGKAMRTSADAVPTLLPDHRSAEGMRTAIGSEKAGVLVETAFLLRGKASEDTAARRRQLASIYGLMRSFSSLQGIEYYSISHGRMRTLYAESYRIDGPDSRQRMPDPPLPPPDGIPTAETLYAFQRDLSFGANVYAYSFACMPEAVRVEVTNLTRMSFAVIPVLAPYALHTRLLVIQAAEGIIFYVESNAAAPGFLRSRLGESFANRAAALFAWFEKASASFLPDSNSGG